MKQSFLCGNCKREMCDDCKNIAEEYQELLELRTTALQSAQHENEQLKNKLSNLQRRADMYEQVSKAGFGDVIGAWMDKEINQLLKTKASE